MEKTKLIEKYFTLTNLQQQQFAMLENLYTEWNEKINVVSRKDIEHLYTNHILHSLAIAKIAQFTNQTNIIDVGTGGGFPGIPLAIMFPNVNFYLVDSIAKKITVVKEVASALELKNVVVEQKRVETITKTFDFIVSRAVTAFPPFVQLTKKLLHDKNKNTLRNGILYLKGGDFYGEIAQYKQKVKVIDITDFFEEEFFETKKIIYLPK
jgi:16S rRNA (guanine527-N7)-methyltransferase